MNLDDVRRQVIRGYLYTTTYLSTPALVELIDNMKNDEVVLNMMENK